MPEQTLPQSTLGGRKGGLRVMLASISGFTQKNILSEPFIFQAPPLDTFEVSDEFTHTDYTTLKLGQLSRPASRMLTTISFDTLFVDYEPWWSYREVNPKAAALTLKNILQTGSPFRLTITNPDRWTTPDVDMAATLRSLRVSERSGEDETRYTNVSFTEFRSEALVLGTAPVVKGVTVVAVETLPAGQRTVADLAKTYYGSSSETESIRQSNSFLSTVGNNTDLVEAFGDDATARIRIPGAVR